MIERIVTEALGERRAEHRASQDEYRQLVARLRWLCEDAVAARSLAWWRLEEWRT